MVRNYKRKTLDRWTKDDLLEALLRIKDSSMKINEAARMYGISRATLYRQYQRFIQGGGQCDAGQFRTCGGNPILTKLEEDVLEKTIKDLRDQGFTVSCGDIKRICFEYCETNGIPTQFAREKRMASDDWYYGFLKRHPEMRVAKPGGGDDEEEEGTEKGVSEASTGQVPVLEGEGEGGAAPPGPATVAPSVQPPKTEAEEVKVKGTPRKRIKREQPAPPSLEAQTVDFILADTGDVATFQLQEVEGATKPQPPPIPVISAPASALVRPPIIKWAGKKQAVPAAMIITPGREGEGLTPVRKPLKRLKGKKRASAKSGDLPGAGAEQLAVNDDLVNEEGDDLTNVDDDAMEVDSSGEEMDVEEEADTEGGGHQGEVTDSAEEGSDEDDGDGEEEGPSGADQSESGGSGSEEEEDASEAEESEGQDEGESGDEDEEDEAEEGGESSTDFEEEEGDDGEKTEEGGPVQGNNDAEGGDGDAKAGTDPAEAEVQDQEQKQTQKGLEDDKEENQKRQDGDEEGGAGQTSTITDKLSAADGGGGCEAEKDKDAKGDGD